MHSILSDFPPNAIVVVSFMIVDFAGGKNCQYSTFCPQLVVGRTARV